MGRNNVFYIVAISLLLNIFLNENLCAQQNIRKISGIVTDTFGPLIGVTIEVVDKAAGTITDFNGQFTINASKGDILRFSYIGYVTEEIEVNEKPTLNIQLKESTKLLDEIVVVGYGSQKKSDITGSMLNVKGENIKQAPVANLASALQGLAAGVDVQMPGGATHPGAVPQIRIRGERSVYAGNDVLLVVDGIPFAGSLTDISTNDIENISILKDASSTAIYGSRGANGVILITTKKGVKGKIKVNYSGYYGITSAIKNFNVMQSNDYIKLKQWAVFNASDEGQFEGPNDPNMMEVGSGKVFRDQEEMNGFYAGNDTNWQKLIFRNGITTDHQILISGGTEQSRYTATLGYYKGQNNYKGHNFERLTAKVSVDTDIRPFLRIGLITLNTFSKNKGQDLNPMDQALRASPFITPYDENGVLRTYLPGSGQNVWNPLLDEQKGAIVDNRKTLSTFISAYGEAILPYGLKYRMNTGIQLRNNTIGKFQASNTTKRMGGKNWAYSESGFNEDYTIENIVTWDKKLENKHNINLTGLFSFQENKKEMNKLDSYDYYDDNVQYHNPGLAQSGLNGGGIFIKSSILSWMGRLNYNYKEKYLLTTTIRQDGSSVLADGNKWDTFPSIAIGWNLIRENFMRKFNFISKLKFRGSLGSVGNAAINPYQTLALLDRDRYILGSDGVMGVYPKSVPDKSLKWERTKTLNFGVDFGFLSNRITGALEVYQQKTTNLLLQITLPPTSGYTNHVTNIGATKSRSIERMEKTTRIDSLIILRTQRAIRYTPALAPTASLF